MNIVRLFVAGTEVGHIGDAAGRDGQRGDRSHLQHQGRWRDGVMAVAAPEGFGGHGQLRVGPLLSSRSPVRPHIVANRG